MSIEKTSQQLQLPEESDSEYREGERVNLDVALARAAAQGDTFAKELLATRKRNLAKQRSDDEKRRREFLSAEKKKVATAREQIRVVEEVQYPVRVIDISHENLAKTPEGRELLEMMQKAKKEADKTPATEPTSPTKPWDRLKFWKK